MNNDHIDKQEEKLGKLLASMKTEIVLPDDFEEQFLTELHQRNSHIFSNAPTVKSGIWEKVKTFVSNISSSRWSYRTAGAVTVLGIATIVLSDQLPNSLFPGKAGYGNDSVNMQNVNAQKDVPFSPDNNTGSTSEDCDKDKDKPGS